MSDDGLSNENWMVKMKKYNYQMLIVVLLNMIMISSSHAMDVAITVDDIPANADLPASTTRTKIAEKMLRVFKKHHIAGVYGLINGGKVEDGSADEKILEDWVDRGQLLGNHTYNHLDLAKVSSQEFIADIEKNEPILKSVMGEQDFHFFRYPYLSEGNTQEKRDSVRKYLFDHHYKIAPVTVDFFEYEWNDPYVRCLAKHDGKSISWLQQSYIVQALNALTISHALSMMLYNRDIKNVLIIHINAMTTDMLDELLTAYENNGVKWIPLDEALSDDVYNYNPNIVRDRAYTFLNQVRLSKGLDNPPIVDKLYSELPEDELNSLCK
jgi:peptidoglycan/xylan/chitin deacetylase (PgdA/CDA1 family)